MTKGNIDEFREKLVALANEYQVSFQEINQALVFIYNPKNKEIKKEIKKPKKKKEPVIVDIDKECQS